MIPELEDADPGEARRSLGIRRWIAQVLAVARAVAPLPGDRRPELRGHRRARPHPVDKAASYPIND